MAIKVHLCVSAGVIPVIIPVLYMVQLYRLALTCFLFGYIFLRYVFHSALYSGLIVIEKLNLKSFGLSGA